MLPQFRRFFCWRHAYLLSENRRKLTKGSCVKISKAVKGCCNFFSIFISWWMHNIYDTIKPTIWPKCGKKALSLWQVCRVICVHDTKLFSIIWKTIFQVVAPAVSLDDCLLWYHASSSLVVLHKSILCSHFASLAFLFHVWTCYQTTKNWKLGTI